MASSRSVDCTPLLLTLLHSNAFSWNFLGRNLFLEETRCMFVAKRRIVANLRVLNHPGGSSYSAGYLLDSNREAERKRRREVRGIKENRKETEREQRTPERAASSKGRGLMEEDFEPVTPAGHATLLELRSRKLSLY